MRRDSVRRFRNDQRFAKVQPLRDSKQPFQHRETEELDERAWIVSQNEQLRARRIHGLRQAARKGFTAAGRVATLKFMEAEVSLSCEGLERYLGE